MLAGQFGRTVLPYKLFFQVPHISVCKVGSIYQVATVLKHWEHFDSAPKAKAQSAGGSERE